MRPSLLVYGQDVGGARVLLPVVKRLRRERTTSVTVLGTEPACDIFHLAGVPCRTLEAAGLGPPVRDREVVRWVAALSPDLYVSDAGHLRDRTAVRLLSACRRLGVPTVALLDHWKNLDRFRGRNGDGFRHAPDVLGVMDRGTSRMLERLGLERDRIRVVGHPYLEEMHRTRRRLLARRRVASLRRQVGVPGDAVLVLCCSEVLHVHGPDSPCTRSCRPLFQGATPEGTLLDTVRLAAERASARTGRRVVIAVRPHPYERRMFAAGGAAPVPMLHDGVCSDVEAVAAADIVMGLTAMPLIQAYVLGKPVVGLTLPTIVERAGDPMRRFHWDTARTFTLVKDESSLTDKLTALIRGHRPGAMNQRVRSILRDATLRVLREIRLLRGRYTEFSERRRAAREAGYR